VVSSLFPPRILKENGNTNSYIKSNYMASGALSLSQQGPGDGALFNVYDQDPTTGYKFINSVQAHGHMRWDFKERVEFKNIYAYIELDSEGVAGGTVDVKLQGSDDGKAWTTLATDGIAPSDPTTQVNLLATDVSYRYIQLLGEDNMTDDFSVTCLIIQAVI